MTQTPSRFKTVAALAMLTALSLPFPASAQNAASSSANRPGSTLSPRDVGSRDFGRREYERSCASCHGASGKGDGVLAGLLVKNPPDLTQLTRSNQGVFPFQRLYQVIDGEGLAAHGTRDMPVWGREYRLEDGQYFFDSPTPYDPQALVRSRILGLLEYISRLQVR